MFLVEDAEIVWFIADRLRLLQQIGAIEAPASY